MICCSWLNEKVSSIYKQDFVSNLADGFGGSQTKMTVIQGVTALASIQREGRRPFNAVDRGGHQALVHRA
jgi:hypothetical protein